MQGGSHPNVKIVFTMRDGVPEIGLFDKSCSTLVEGVEGQYPVWITEGGSVIEENRREENGDFKLLKGKEAIFWFSRAGKLEQCPDGIIRAHIIK